MRRKNVRTAPQNRQRMASQRRRRVAGRLAYMDLVKKDRDVAVNPMLSAGANGIQQGLKALDSVAQEIAELNLKGDPGSSEENGTRADGLDDLASAMVDLKLYQRQVQASAKVVETADEVIGFLLDVRA